MRSVLHLIAAEREFQITNFTNPIALGKSLQIAMCAISVLICSVCGIEGGYQLHLSHEHSAISCVKLRMPVPLVPGDQIDPLTYEVAPVCKDPDEPGQPWRLRLVLMDMLGFIAFGTIGFHKSKQLMFAGAAGD